MVIGIGRNKEPQDIVDQLLECHDRIRRFTAMAVRLAEAEGAPDADVRDAATRLQRYFGEALPLHAADEDESITPRLRGRASDVDAELAAMMKEHEAHQSDLQQLTSLCARLQAAPDQLAGLRDELLAVARALEAGFVPHLDREEKVIFPAMRQHLDEEAQKAIASEMKARRFG